MKEQYPGNVNPELWRMAKRRVDFKHHFTIYMLVIPFLWAIWGVNVIWFGGWNSFPWPIWPTLGWGFGLLINYIFVYIFPQGADSKESIQREYEKLSGQQ